MTEAITATAAALDNAEIEGMRDALSNHAMREQSVSCVPQLVISREGM